MTARELRLPPHLAGLDHGYPVDVYAGETRPGDLILDTAGDGAWAFVDSVADYQRGREYRFNTEDPLEPIVLHDANLVRVTAHSDWQHGPKPNGAEPGRIHIHAYTPTDIITVRKLLRPGGP